MTDQIEGVKERLKGLLNSPESKEAAVTDLIGVILRLLWHLHLTPFREAQDLSAIYCSFFVPFARRHIGNGYEDRELRDWAIDTASAADTEFLRRVSAVPFEDFVNNELIGDAEPDDEGIAFLESVWRQWQPRIAGLTPRLVSSIRTVHEEYLVWLRRHPNVLDTIAWEAFEQIVAEIFASKGFQVDLTGRLRNRSADIIAVRSDEFGVETKYLIECKRYAETRRIGMDVVNGVIGAARRADADHAFLVTSSFYTADVLARKTELAQLRMHLRDGDDVRQWLRTYTERKDGGLWLSPGWDEDIQQSGTRDGVPAGA